MIYPVVRFLKIDEGAQGSAPLQKTSPHNFGQCNSLGNGFLMWAEASLLGAEEVLILTLLAKAVGH